MRTDFDPSRLSAVDLIIANERKQANRDAWHARAAAAFLAGNDNVGIEISVRLATDPSFQ